METIMIFIVFSAYFNFIQNKPVRGYVFIIIVIFCLKSICEGL